MTRLTVVGGNDFVPNSRSDYRPRIPVSRKNLRFLSKDRILESDEADLIHDVCCNTERARTKLRLISKRLTGLKQQSALEIEQLTEAQKKLSAAISAAQEMAKTPARKPVTAARKEVLTA